jgi:phage shock protein PspC (stress-responsive transcriptional regulator)
MNASDDTTPVLAGVCSRFAGLLQFNVWALRAVFIILLLAKTLLAVLVYVVLAFILRAVDKHRSNQVAAAEQDSSAAADHPVYSDRIRDLDRRFNEWEQSLGK